VRGTAAGVGASWFPLLEQAGHVVHTPTLTGLGDRAHLARADISLDQHAQDVVALLEMEDLRDVTLVGHSYGGAVIGIAAARARTRIRQLIYLDAFVPERGSRVIDYLLPLDRREAIVKAGEASGYVAAIPPQALGVTDLKDVEWINARLARQPYTAFSQPMMVDLPADLPRGYIACTQPASGSFGQFAAKFKTDPAWRYQELATGHNAMIIAPALLARTLMDWAG
jgi:pimeloyl-ACP methyl ester carboxylesterase